MMEKPRIAKQNGEWTVITRTRVAFCVTWENALSAALYFAKWRCFPAHFVVHQ